MHALKLVLGLVLLVVGVVATPVGAQDIPSAAGRFLALTGVQAETLSDQELDTIKGQAAPSFTVFIPNQTSCTTGCTGVPVSGFFILDGSGGGMTFIINGVTVAETADGVLVPGGGLNISSGGVVAIPPAP